MTRRFFYIPIDHFKQGKVWYFYPTADKIDAVLMVLRQPPWGGILNAKVLTGDYFFTRHITTSHRGLWDIMTNLELKELLNGKKASPEILEKIAKDQHVVGVGSVFFVDALSKLAGAGELSESIIHGIAAATEQAKVYELFFENGKEPVVMDLRTNTRLELSIPKAFPGYNREEIPVHERPDFIIGAGMDGAMG